MWGSAGLLLKQNKRQVYLSEKRWKLRVDPSDSFLIAVERDLGFYRFINPKTNHGRQQLAFGQSAQDHSDYPVGSAGLLVSCYRYSKRQVYLPGKRRKLHIIHGDNCMIASERDSTF